MIMTDGRCDQATSPNAWWPPGNSSGRLRDRDLGRPTRPPSKTHDHEGVGSQPSLRGQLWTVVDKADAARPGMQCGRSFLSRAMTFCCGPCLLLAEACDPVERSASFRPGGRAAGVRPSRSWRGRTGGSPGRSVAAGRSHRYPAMSGSIRCRRWGRGAGGIPPAPGACRGARLPAICP